jgi:hypothetical protein
MSLPVATQREPLTDSPWFWLYLFATFGLALLLVMEPKFRDRQLQLERRSQGWQRSQEVQRGEEPSTEMSTPGNLRITLRPLLIIFAGVVTLGWVFLWWKRFRPRMLNKSSTPGGST